MAPKRSKSKSERLPVLDLVSIIELFLVHTHQASINLGGYAKFGTPNAIHINVILNWAEPIAGILKHCNSGVLNWDCLRSAFCQLFDRVPACDPNKGKDCNTLESAEECATGLKRMVYNVRKLHINGAKFKAVSKKLTAEQAAQLQGLVDMIKNPDGDDESLAALSPRAACQQKLERHDSAVSVASSSSSWPYVGGPPEEEGLPVAAPDIPAAAPEVPALPPHVADLAECCADIPKVPRPSLQDTSKFKKPKKIHVKINKKPTKEHTKEPLQLPDLPAGYSVEAKLRKSGEQQGNHYYIYFGPDGKLLRSMKEVIKHSQQFKDKH